MPFTRRKFLGLSEKQRHKKAAELLREYWELCHWQGLLPPGTSDEEISNRYHEHLQRAGQHLREHDLLVREGDKAVGAPYLPIIIYLDHLRSAHNVGSIVRTVEALRLGEVWLSEQTPHPTQKTTMGADQWVTCKKEVKADKLVAPLIALETSSNAMNLFDFVFPDSFCLAVGNEEIGCSAEVLRRADVILEIPLCGRKNSLNVANAFAIAAAQIRRQR